MEYFGLRIANSGEPDQTAVLGTVWPGSTSLDETWLLQNLELLRKLLFRFLRAVTLNIKYTFCRLVSVIYLTP